MKFKLNSKRFLTLAFIFLLGEILLFPLFTLSQELKVDKETVAGTEAKPQCCKLKHTITGWGAIGTGSYNAGTWVGAASDADGNGDFDANDKKIICPQPSGNYNANPNWAGFCMLDAIASVGDIVKYAAMVAVGVALLIAAIMFIGAAGSPEKVKLAKSIFFYSLIGVLIATLANFLPGIVRFFLGI